MFCMGSMSIFVLEYALTISLTEYFKIWHMYSYALALTLGLVLLFIYQRLVTFRAHVIAPGSFLRFIMVYASSYATCWSLVLIVTSIGLDYKIAIVLISAILSVFTYTVNKTWVFKEDYPSLIRKFLIEKNLYRRQKNQENKNKR